MFASHAPDDLDQIAFAADEGFLAWEDNGMAGRSIEFQTRFAQIMQKRGMQMGIFVAHQIDWQKPTLTTGDAAIRDRFVSDIKASTVVAQRINATWVTTVIGRVAQNLPFGHQFANVVDALRRAADVCEPSGMVMVVEPLNWRDHPGQFGNTSDVLRAVVKAVEHPSVKILQDLYHLQVTEGNLIDNMDRSWDDIAYFQLGDNPGRCEPGTGEVNYRNIFRHIHQRGYSGILGMEHGNSAPGKEGERKVIEAYRACDDFQA
jgi:hydroxypyruvate isomerase